MISYKQSNINSSMDRYDIRNVFEPIENPKKISQILLECPFYETSRMRTKILTQDTNEILNNW